MPPKGQCQGNPEALAATKKICRTAAPDAKWQADHWGFSTVVNATRIRVTSCWVTVTKGRGKNKVKISAKVAQTPERMAKRICEAIAAAQETP